MSPPVAIALLDWPIAWPLLCLALVGIGGAVRAGLERLDGGKGGAIDQVREDGCHAFPRDGWLGWGVTLGALQLWHLFWPVNGIALGWFLAVGIGLLGWRWRRTRLRPGWRWGLLLAVLAAWLASSWTFRSLAVDTGLYHLGALRWARTYRIVPGLGLLHHRLAFNNSSFLWAALCDHWPWGLDRAAAGVEILFFFALANGCLGVRRLMRPARPAAARDVFDAFSLVPLLTVAMEDFRYDGPLSPDLLLFPLGLMAISELLGFLDRPDASRAFPVLLLSACAVTVKVSFAGAALAAWLAVLRVAGAKRRVRWLAAGVAVWIGGAWSLRSVLLSGWPVPLLPVFGAPVSWRIPASELSAQRELIVAWARAPGGGAFVLAEWLREMARQRFAIVVPLLVWVASLAAGMTRRRFPRAWLALAAPAAGLVFWLFTAPLTRFASSLPWALALAALAAAAAGLSGRGLRRGLGLLLLLLGLSVIDPWSYLVHARNGPPAIPYVELRIAATDSGFAVLVPAEGDQCWDAPLPHTPRLDPRLEPRDPYTLNAGFRRAGD